jgi:serine phosphatase RsbU (regulator of sigma subunit)
MMDPAGELFGNARLMEAIGQGRSVPLQERVTVVLEELERWRGPASAQDDISIVAVEVLVTPRPGEPSEEKAETL